MVTFLDYQMATHKEPVRHKHNMAKGLHTHQCDLCNRCFNNKANYMSHLRGKDHLKHGTQLGKYINSHTGNSFEIAGAEFELTTAPLVGDNLLLDSNTNVDGQWVG